METSLKILKQKLQNILPVLNWTSEQISTSGQTYIKIGGLNKIRPIITELNELNLFEAQVNFLKNSIVFTSTNDLMQIQYTEGNQVVVTLANLKSLTQNLAAVLSNVIPEEDADSINIKLPPINDFEELSKVSHDIHISLTQILYNEEINGQTKIVSVENGSIWLNVFIGGAGGVAIVGALVWSAAVIYKKIQEGRLLEQTVRGMEVKNTSIEDILTAQKKSTELMIKAEAEYIQTTHFKENAPENIERIKNSVKTLAELIEKGAEIHPALVAPEQVSNLFPNVKNLLGVESKIKRIGEG